MANIQNKSEDSTHTTEFEEDNVAGVEKGGTEIKDGVIEDRVEVKDDMIKDKNEKKGGVIEDKGEKKGSVNEDKNEKKNDMIKDKGEKKNDVSKDKGEKKDDDNSKKNKAKDPKETPAKPKSKTSLASSTPKASPRATPRATKRKTENSLGEEEAEAKKTKIVKTKNVTKKGKKIEAKKDNTDKGFKFNDDMLDEFNKDDITFSSTKIESVSDTMILGEYERVYEPNGVYADSDDDEDTEVEPIDEEKMEEDPVGEKESETEVKLMKEKIEELMIVSEEQDLVIASLKSELDEKENERKEKELKDMGKFNSLEEDKKVLRDRLARYIVTVPKMKDELSELRKAVKDKMIPNSNKAEVNKLKKALKESEDKVEKVTIEKVKHETEAKMMTRMNQNLEQMLAMIQKTGSVQVTPLSPAATAPAADSSRETDKRKFKCYK